MGCSLVGLPLCSGMVGVCSQNAHQLIGPIVMTVGAGAGSLKLLVGKKDKTQGLQSDQRHPNKINEKI